MTTTEAVRAETLTPPGSPLVSVPDLTYVETASRAAANAMEGKNTIIYGLENIKAVSELSAQLGWLALNCYGQVPEKVKLCRPDDDPVAQVNKSFSDVQKSLRANGANTLVILEGIDKMAGASETQPTAPQLKVIDKVNELINSPLRPKIIGISMQDIEDNVMNIDAGMLIDRFAGKTAILTAQA